MIAKPGKFICNKLNYEKNMKSEKNTVLRGESGRFRGWPQFSWFGGQNQIKKSC